MGRTPQSNGLCQYKNLSRTECFWFWDHKNGTPFTRNQIIKHSDNHKVGIRLLFAGIVKQPYMKDKEYRVVDTLDSTNKIMEDTFWIGLYQGITPEMIDYMVQVIYNFIHEREYQLFLRDFYNKKIISLVCPKI